MELEYQTLSQAITDFPNILIDYNQANSGQLDNLYSWKSIYKKGTSGNDFSQWSRYNHVKGGVPEAYSATDFENPLNPYLFDGNFYNRTQNLSGSKIDFQNGFLESERLTSNLMIPGDIYEIKTKIENTKGTIDIAIKTGDLETTPLNPTGSFSTLNVQSGSNYSSINYDKTRGIEVFSTFNSAFKWYRSLSSIASIDNRNQLRTSNLFVMPNVPSGYQGFNIQVGAGNSDIYYHTDPTSIFDNSLNTNNYFKSKNSYIFAQSTLGTFPIQSSGNIPHQFGIGMPWGMMVPMYEALETYNSVTSDKSMFRTWFHSTYTYNLGGPSFYKLHRPTTLCTQTVADPNTVAGIEEIELIRYSKNPYMLRGVKIYRVNGGNETTGKQLVSQKQIDYDYVTKNLIENYDYVDYLPGNITIREDAQRKRIVFRLTKVHELPLDATLLAVNFGLTDPSKVLTTTFGYTEASSVTLSSVFEVRGDKIFVLNSITDNLGGVTTILYKPLSNINYTSDYNPQKNSIAIINDYSSYGDGVLYNVSVIVDKVQKQDNGSLQEWSYTFSNQIIKENSFALNTNYFRNAFVRSKTRGYKNVTINLPTVNGITARTEIEHYGGLANNALDYLCFGKVKTSKQYMNNILNSETTNNYDITLAFEHGAIRPSFKKNHLSYNENMTASYLYEDYKKDQSLFTSLSESKADLTTYYNSYNPTSIKAEQPKMLECFFYTDILSANNNNAYLLNSYFVKLVSQTSKVYEDGLYRMPNSFAGPCYDFLGNIIPCPVTVIEPSSCSNTLSTSRQSIETTTTYTYYEANQTGLAQGTAYQNLLGINTNSPVTINFATYGMGSGSQNQGVLYLKHEPSWQLASKTVTSPQMGTANTKEEYFYFYDLYNRYDRHWYYYDIVSNPKFSIQIINGETLAVNNIVTNVKRTNTNSLPRYEGMESTRSRNTRGVAFQKTTFSKNASDSKPLSRSEYYHYDNSWTYPSVQNYQPVFLRFAGVQIDTTDYSNGGNNFRSQRIDRNNKYIADFRATTAAVQPDGKNYIYTFLCPFDQLKTQTITERNRFMMPLTLENQMGVKTRYNINTTISGSGSMTNLGLVESFIIGYTRSDYMTSTFEYNNQGLIKKMIEPSARYVEYLYDNYLRLIKTTENGTRILSENEYSNWNSQNTTYTFEQRTNQNNILTTIYNSSTTNDKELLKSFIDPLGRQHSTLQAYYDLSSTLNKIHSPTVQYDEWNRIEKTYKTYSGTGTNLDLSNNTTTPFMEVNYENQLNSRVIKSADYGENITSSTHTVNKEYKIVNGVVAFCELGLTNDEAKIMMTSSYSGGAFKFLRETITDQDGKQTISYTNAYGQLAATVSFTDATTKALTLFGYDSYGNLSKTLL